MVGLTTPHCGSSTARMGAIWGSTCTWSGTRRPRSRRSCPIDGDSTPRPCSPCPWHHPRRVRGGRRRRDVEDMVKRARKRGGARVAVDSRRAVPRRGTHMAGTMKRPRRRPHRIPVHSRGSSSRRGGCTTSTRARATSCWLVHGTPTWSFEWRHVIRGLAPYARCWRPTISVRPLDRPRTRATRRVTPRTCAVSSAPGPSRPDARRPTTRRPDRPARSHSTPSGSFGSSSSTPGCGSFDGTAAWSGGPVLGGALGRFLYRTLNFSLRVVMPSPT